MMDHTHLQLCFTLSTGTYQTPTSNQSLPSSPTVIYFLFSKATSSNQPSLLGNTKACCHQVVEQVAKGSLVDKYAIIKKKKKVMSLFNVNYFDSDSLCMKTMF